MKSLRLLSLFAIGAAPALLAGPCVTGTLQSYIALGTTGCTLGPFTDKDFAFTDISGIPITASDITVTPVFTSTGSGPALSDLEFTSPLFNVTGSQSLKLLIAYFWDAADIRSLDEVMNDPVTPPALSQLTINGCENANFVGSTCPTTMFTLLLQAMNLSQTMVSASENFTPGTVSTLGMRDTIEIDGNNCSPNPSFICADITDFHDTAQTPEPSALLLSLLPAVLGVGLWHRRRHLHAR